MMQQRGGWVVAVWLLVSGAGVLPSDAATWFVSPAGSDANAGTNWVTAKRNIQAAVDLAVDGDTVLVTNGVYTGSGRTYGSGTLTNRLIVTNDILVTSVNGSGVTSIQGNNAGFARGVAVRCVVLTKGTLSGFSLENGSSNTNLANADDYNGGGVLLRGGTVSNCVIQSCKSAGGGAGAAGDLTGLIVDSTLRFNTANTRGGGAAGVVLQRCLILQNTALATYGGGIDYCKAYDCLIRGNAAGTSGGGVFGNFDTFGCTIVNNSAGGNGGGVDFVNLRNCIVWSNTATSGDPNLGSSGAGAVNSCAPVPFTSGFANTTNHPRFVDPANGDWRVGRDSPCVDAGDNAFVTGALDFDRYPRVVNGTVDMGCYEHQIWHVATNGSDAADGLSWATAKQTIQAGVNAARIGETVLVSNGLYATGATATPGYSVSNRVYITNNIVVTSVNGPAFTTIQGSNATLTTGMRCVYITRGLLSGFTLTNGAAPYLIVPGLNLDASNLNINAGGAYAVGAAISNCVFANNSAFYYGGGSFGGTIANCRYAGNTASGGAGAYTGLLNNCVIAGNRADAYGGGTMNSTANNALLVSNTATYGGGSYFGTLNNCTLAANSATYGGGSYVDVAHNCIAYFNAAPTGPNYFSSGFTNSCSTPLPPGPGNVAGNPLFVNTGTGDYRLKAASPARDSGGNGFAIGTADLAGNARIANGTVDMGAYEYDQATATYDSDADGFSDAEEYVADTQPTNAASFFPGLLLTGAPVGETSLVIGQTSTGRVYGIYSTTDLLASPQVWTLVPPEQTGTGTNLTLTVPNALPAANYRTGVRLP